MANYSSKIIAQLKYLMILFLKASSLVRAKTEGLRLPGLIIKWTILEEPELT